MREIGYFKFVNENHDIKDGVYEYIIDPRSNTIGIINPVRTNGVGGWEVNVSDLELGYKKGERVLWVTSSVCGIETSPALKLLYGVEE